MQLHELLAEIFPLKPNQEISKEHTLCMNMLSNFKRFCISKYIDNPKSVSDKEITNATYMPLEYINYLKLNVDDIKHIFKELVDQEEGLELIIATSQEDTKPLIWFNFIYTPTKGI